MVLRLVGRSVSLCENPTETVKAAFRQSTALRDPVRERGEASGFDPARADPPDFLGPDETALFQHLKMLDDCGKRRVERFGQGTDGGWSMAQPLYDGPAGRLCEGSKAAVHDV